MSWPTIGYPDYGSCYHFYRAPAASGSGLLLCPGYPRFLVLFSPCPVAVAGFPAAGSADVSFCFDLFRCEIRKKDGTAESVLRSGL